MTINAQLREIARRADEHQRPITVEEIMARASEPGSTARFEPTGARAVWRHRRYWLLVAAAVVVVAAAFQLLAIEPEEGSDSVRTVTGPPTTPAAPLRNGWIAFAADAGAGAELQDPVDFQRIETVPEPMDIYITRHGEPSRRLVSTGAHERCPAFSPDGERLAYLAVPGTPPGGSWPTTGPPLDATIVVLRFDGAVGTGDPELEVHLPVAWGYSVRRDVGYACPRWSPDGRRLAYLAQSVEAVPPTADVAELRVLTLDGQERTVNSEMTADEGSSFAWSPAGDAIAYIRDDGVWAATLDGRAPSLVWRPDGSPRGVSWSTRGELAVTVEPPGSHEGFEVHIVDVDAGTATLVDRQSSGVTSWSPDGSRLAIVRDQQIVLVDRADGSSVRLPPPAIDAPKARVVDVAWSPAGDQLLALVWAEDPTAMWGSRGLALLALATDGALIDVLTPWTFAFDWTSLHDGSWQPDRTGG